MTMMMNLSMRMIGMTAGGTDPQLFHIIYWVVIIAAFLVSFKLFNED